MIALAIPIGLIIGLTLGALGGGGSILTVPALVYLLGQDTQDATTGSLIIVGITAFAGMTAHHRGGRVRVAAGLVFGVLGVGGAYVGSLLSASVAPSVLMSAFSLLMLVVAAMMFARARRGRGSSPAADVGMGEEPILMFRPSFACACPRALKVLITASAVGLLTGFFGVGGGFVVVPALVLALGFTMPVAVGTSLLVIAINSASALVARAGHGVQLDWPLIGVFTLAAIVGSLAGGRLATRVRPERLTAAFTVLLVAVALYTAARSFPQLV
ncbi:MAG: sulfite exporter TauE/SafE family protein [Dermatophilaceae bacterium]|nr:sulfite exporter TauE/SafE family protein [Dermatophilaceae bacterium]